MEKIILFFLLIGVIRVEAQKLEKWKEDRLREDSICKTTAISFLINKVGAKYYNEHLAYRQILRDNYSRLILFDVKKFSVKDGRDILPVYCNLSSVDTLHTKIDKKVIRNGKTSSNSYLLLIDSNQAVKIAQHIGFNPNKRNWNISLVLYAGDKLRPIWGITTREYSTGTYAGGTSYSINAITGEIQEGQWDSMP